jgi:hypothetical protein
VLEHYATVPMDNRFRKASGARRIRNEERMVERDRFELKLRRSREQISPENIVISQRMTDSLWNRNGGFQPDQCPSDLRQLCTTIDPLITVEVARHGDKDLWRDLSETIDNATSSKLGRT